MSERAIVGTSARMECGRADRALDRALAARRSLAITIVSGVVDRHASSSMIDASHSRCVARDDIIDARTRVMIASQHGAMIDDETTT
jgi:hypothetical protein